MYIRKFEIADAPALADLYRRSVEVLGPNDYSAAQVAAWISLTPTAEVLRERYSDGRIALVALGDHNNPLAFGDIEADGHINFFYCMPEVAGQGVSFAVYRALEYAARQAGLTRIYVEASEGARRFFRRQGFVVLGRRDFTIGNVPIHNYAMEKEV